MEKEDKIKSDKKLLILNLSGFLVHRTNNPKKVKPNYKHDLKIGQVKIWIRPHAKTFLKYCLENFNIAIWTSVKIKNILPILDALFNEEDKNKLVFIWGQEQCTPSGKKTYKNWHKEVFYKEIKKVWNEFSGYGSWNTLLIDEDKYKARKNIPFSSIHPKAWTGQENDNFLIDTNFTSWLENLKTSQNVINYVQTNEFSK